MSFKESNYYKHAVKEFELLGYKSIEECDGPNKWIQENVLELLEVFGRQKHSGSSAPFCIDYFKKLAGFSFLSPLTFNDGEFNEVGNNTYQNNRLSSVFKNGVNGRPYYLYNIIWKSQNGSTFTGTVDGVSSSQYIKLDHPFEEKQFVIDVIEWEVNKDTNEPQEGSGWWEAKIKDWDQLIEVSEYYDFKENK